jgi:hypothetical protein
MLSDYRDHPKYYNDLLKDARKKVVTLFFIIVIWEKLSEKFLALQTCTLIATTGEMIIAGLRGGEVTESQTISQEVAASV